MDTYMTINDVARRINVKPATLRKYRSDGRLPDPDIQIAQSPAWLPETIENWIPTRPGQGVGGGRKPQTDTPDPAPETPEDKARARARRTRRAKIAAGRS